MFSRELGSQSHPPSVHPTLTAPTSSSTSNTTTQSPNEPALQSKSHIDIQRRPQRDNAQEIDSDNQVVGSCTTSDQHPIPAQCVKPPHETVTEVLTEGTPNAANEETSDELCTASVQDVRGSNDDDDDDGEEGMVKEISGAVVSTQSLCEDPVKGVFDKTPTNVVSDVQYKIF